MPNISSAPRVAIACGGTGGHLFPGVAVAEALQQRGCVVTLLISPKEIDQTAVKTASVARVATLPAVGLSGGNAFAFARGFLQSYRAAARLFKSDPPEAVLAMGGFTSAPPVLAGRARRTPTFLHESNTIPGRANLWLSRIVGQAFVGFPETSARLRVRSVKVTGTPVRPQFQPTNAAKCRAALGLAEQGPVLLVTGGSQGASGLNAMVMAALPYLARLAPDLQLFHLTGPNDVELVRGACAAIQIKSVVRPFFGEMHLALGAASAAISRAGASSLAELAAMRVPAILVPYPAATGNHQFYNASAFEKTGAAILLGQGSAPPEALAARIVELLRNERSREKMRAALGAWHAPRAAAEIAESILQAITARRHAIGGAVISASPGNGMRNSHIPLSTAAVARETSSAHLGRA